MQAKYKKIIAVPGKHTKSFIMLRVVFTAVVFIHALIHLMGFVNAWKLAEVKGLAGGTLFSSSPFLSKLFGVLWLLATLCFILAGVLFLLKRELWWALAFSGVLLSQMLIVIHWPVAKWGTVANALILIVAIIAFATEQFHKNVERTALTILSTTPHETEEIVTEAMLQGLPHPVKQWLLNCGIVGNEKIRSVRLKQKGLMRTNANDEKWMEANAEQYIAITQPAFVWKVKLHMLPLVPVVGCDQFIEGKGRMNIKLLSLINMVYERDEKIDQGALQRYLAEIIWAPSAALLPCIKWESIDSFSAKATMTYKNTSGSVVFHFNNKGDVTHCTADRYKGGGATATLEKWEVRTTSYSVLGGIRMPVTSEATWKLKEGDFTWYKLQITELEYNKPQLYKRE